MTIVFENDKIAFSEWTLDDREETAERAREELGASYVYDSFMDAVRERSDEIGYDLTEAEWYDAELDPSDGVYDNAGESVCDALLEIALLVYATSDMSWDDALSDTLGQVWDA